jgi:AraC-like DNA-binding protein
VSCFGHAMDFERHQPGPPLAGLVDYLWHISDAPAHARERIVPNGTLEFVFNLAEDEVRIYDEPTAPLCRRLSGSVVSGVFSRFFVIDTREHACMVGVHFKPGGAFSFLRRLPVVDLANSHLDLSTLWGSKASRLRERLASAATIQQRFHLLETALIGELGSAVSSHRAIPSAIHALGSTSTSIQDLAARANLSQRRLIQLFSLEVGTTPKLFQRLQRYRRAVALMRGGADGTLLAGMDRGGSTWAHVAQLAGYYDQSHLIRDFVSFSGLTPERYASMWTDNVKDLHVPLFTGSKS